MNALNISEILPAILRTPKLEFCPKKGKFVTFVNFESRSFQMASQVHSNLLIANLYQKILTYFQPHLPPLILLFW